MRVYLDHAATTPIRPEAVEAMTAVLAQQLGNASSQHASGRAARRLLDDARDRVAAVLGVASTEVVFTSGGTESDQLAIEGVHHAMGGDVLISAIEHSAVRKALTVGGTPTLDIPVACDGVVDLQALRQLLSPSTSLVSVMAVNNETGVVQPIAEIAALLADVAPQAKLHSDAVQALPWLDVATALAGADLIAISGHKFGAPMGIGALAVRSGTSLDAVTPGGGQELERRGGTQNVAGAVALAVAAEQTVAERAEVTERIGKLRERLVAGLRMRISDLVEPAGDAATHRYGIVPGVLQVCIPGVESEAMLFLLDEAGIDASAGSACASGALQHSHVLDAMGVDPALAAGALRLSFGHTTTDADIDRALHVVPDAVEQLRGIR